MDCGNSFSEAFPGKDMFRADSLKEAIGTITDCKLLGTAMFSHWRYLTHWHNASLSNDTIEWFSVAFDRLQKINAVEKQKRKQV